MSAWTRTLIYLGLREEPDDAVDWEVVEDGPGTDAPQVAAVAPAAMSSRTEPSTNVRQLRGGIDVSTDRVTVVQIRVFDDVETVGARYRHRQPVLFDVSACSREVARRTVDFVSGLTYASRGTLRRTAPRSFLLVPEGVDISLDERRRLSQLGYDVEGAVR
jgi:FtsZ-interacting cell division protein YlmF